MCIKIMCCWAKKYKSPATWQSLAGKAVLEFVCTCWFIFLGIFYALRLCGMGSAGFRKPDLRQSPLLVYLLKLNEGSLQERRTLTLQGS